MTTQSMRDNGRQRVSNNQSGSILRIHTANLKPGSCEGCRERKTARCHVIGEHGRRTRCVEGRDQHPPPAVLSPCTSPTIQPSTSEQPELVCALAIENSKYGQGVDRRMRRVGQMMMRLARITKRRTSVPARQYRDVIHNINIVIHIGPHATSDVRRPHELYRAGMRCCA